MENRGEFRFTHTPVEGAKYVLGTYEPGRVATIQTLIPGDGRMRNALDIGCGSGFFTRILRQRGWKVLAVDTDPQNVESAATVADEARLGDAIGALDALGAGEYELVLALELIEHMPADLGRRLLDGVLRALAPGGRLIVSTPNRHSPEGLYGYYWGEKARGWGPWKAWDNTHVYLYSATELVRALKVAGFRVEQVTGYWYEGTLPVLGRWRLPVVRSSAFPLNRLGFNVIVTAARPPGT